MNKIYVLEYDDGNAFTGGKYETIPEFGAYLDREKAIDRAVDVVLCNTSIQRLTENFLEANLEEYCDPCDYEPIKDITNEALVNFIREEVTKDNGFVNCRVVELKIRG